VMRATRAIISGSSALLLLDIFADFVPEDLDIFVTAPHANTLVNYLIGTEHYWQTSYVVVTEDAQTDVLDVHGGISRVTRLSAGTFHIDVIVSAENTATFPIAHWWTSLLMNFVSADTLCCAYPTLTLERRGLYHPLRLLHPSYPDGTNVFYQNRYSERGYE
ncbi:hypothetical protein B0H21DRAFT_663556, partial [Amylocystis lapponica]